MHLEGMGSRALRKCYDENPYTALFEMVDAVWLLERAMEMICKEMFKQLRN